MAAGGKEPSLLPKLDGKVLIIKDFTPIISGNRDRRAAILGQLRDAYDGSSAMAFGTGDTKSFESRFGLLFEVTPAIEACWPVINTLGERFIYYRCHGGDSLQKAEAAMENSDNKSQMRAELAEASRGVLDQHAPPTIKVGKSIRTQIVHLADFVAKARTPVEREGRSGEVTYTPSPEIGTRLAGQFVQLARGITVARGEVECPESLMEMIRYVGRSAIPHTRLKLLEQLSRASEPEKTSNLGQAVGLGTGTVSRALHDLWALKLVHRVTFNTNAYCWELSQLARDRLSVTRLF